MSILYVFRVQCSESITQSKRWCVSMA